MSDRAPFPSRAELVEAEKFLRAFVESSGSACPPYYRALLALAQWVLDAPHIFPGVIDMPPFRDEEEKP